jgi:hypothetical protein
MYKARKMLPKELQAADNKGRQRVFCVEHDSGKVVRANLTWPEACTEARARTRNEVERSFADLCPA